MKKSKILHQQGVAIWMQTCHNKFMNKPVRNLLLFSLSVSCLEIGIKLKYFREMCGPEIFPAAAWAFLQFFLTPAAGRRWNLLLEDNLCIQFVREN